MRYFYYKTIAFMLSIALIAGCNQIPLVTPEINIKLADGLNQREADLLIQRYLKQHQSCSQCFDGPRDVGYAWVYRATRATDTLPLEDDALLMVDKQTGVISWLEE